MAKSHLVVARFVGLGTAFHHCLVVWFGSNRAVVQAPGVISAATSMTTTTTTTASTTKVAATTTTAMAAAATMTTGARAPGMFFFLH